MYIDDRMKEWIERKEVDFYGVADLSPAHQTIQEQGGPETADYPRAVSLGITLPNSVVDQLPRRHKRAVRLTYRHHGYDVVNRQLDLITLNLSRILQREGFRALPVAASLRVDDKRICGLFSHKLGAHLAGLGWIGKNCLLITPEAGPRVRWGTILTDAPLIETGKRTADGCGDCEECVLVCPVKAFTGRAFREDEPREARFDARKCDRYFDQLKKKNGDVGVCGMCLYICPFGRK